MLYLSHAAILFAATIVFVFSASAQNAGFAEVSTENLVGSNQEYDFSMQSGPEKDNLPAIKYADTFIPSPDALSKEEESAPLPAAQFFPKHWSDLLPVFHSSPDLLITLAGVLLTGLLGTLLSIRTKKD